VSAPSGACQQLTEVASAGVGAALRAVDCMAAEAISSGFSRLFGAEGALAPVLTILLTLYIAFFAFSLITGRSTLGISALTPRMLTLGLVLTFATSWVAYQNVVWNLVIGGPDWIASILMGTKGSATQIFGERIDIIFHAIGEASGNVSQPAGGEGEAQAPAAAQGTFTPAGVMWLGAMILLLGTVGILLTARIALAVLLVLGPVFVVMALFGGTRGLTAGWLRGVVLTAVTPLFVVLGGGITLELLVPVVSSLVEGAQLGEIDARAAMAMFLVAAVHMALMAMVLKVAGTLVSGWQVFGLGGGSAGSSRSRGDAVGMAAPAAGAVAPAAGSHTVQSRTAAVSAAAASHGEGGVQGGPAAPRADRRTVITQVTGGGIEPLVAARDSRARGIGSRFRSASNDTGRVPGKEKIR
jgi:type IV secretion system protein VirB6